MKCLEFVIIFLTIPYQITRSIEWCILWMFQTNFNFLKIFVNGFGQKVQNE